MDAGLIKKMRALLWCMVVLVVIGLIGAALFGRGLDKPVVVPYSGNALSDALGGIGGPFTMTNQKGAVFTEKNLAGKPTLMFFGFTSCPDVCPTTLADMTKWLQQLGPDAGKLNAVFVSVDPERDTPEQMAHYLAMFDPHIIGLTGTPEQLATMAKNYKIYYKKTPLENDNYTMDHTASLYLLNADTKLVGTISYRENDAIAFQKIRRLLAGS